MSTLHDLTSAAPSGRTVPLLLDYLAYSTTVIRQGKPIPWADLPELTGFVGQVVSLLEPDSVWFNVADWYDSQLSRRSEITIDMGEKSRTGFAMRTLLSDDDLIAELQTTLDTVAQTSCRPLVLHLPSPARWISRTHHQAGTPLSSVTEMNADSSSMYIAEWLSKLGSPPVSLVLLDTRPHHDDAPVETPEKLETYQSITNVADHFGWAVALRDPDSVHVTTDTPSVGVIPTSFWYDTADLPDVTIRLGEVPADANPEHILDQLALTR